MKRTLLLLPFLALLLMACPQKHTTSTDTPPKPDPNAYNTAQPDVNVYVPPNGASEEVVGAGTTNTTTTTATVTATDNGTVARHDTIRLIVSFISKGAGIDHAAQANLDKWLSKNIDVEYYMTHTGREGEMDYCFVLNSRNASGQQKVVSDVRGVIGINDRVFIKENVVCTHEHGYFVQEGVVPPPALIETPVEQSKADVDTTRLVISFISKGEGIDYAAKGNLDKWLSKHADVKYTVMQKGREGEMKYCFVMKDRKAGSQVILINEIKTAIGTSDRVLYSEKVVCDHVHELATDSPQVVEENMVVPERPDTSNTARLVVSFTSKGEGIDHKTKEEFEKWLGERGNVTWETKTFGREGETNFCFFLKNMDGRQQDIFVRDVRTYLTGKETVFVEEYAPCDKRK